MKNSAELILDLVLRFYKVKYGEWKCQNRNSNGWTSCILRPSFNIKQVLNTLKGIPGIHSFKLSTAIWISPGAKPWKKELRNISIVRSDMFLFGFHHLLCIFCY